MGSSEIWDKNQSVALKIGKQQLLGSGCYGSNGESFQNSP